MFWESAKRSGLFSLAILLIFVLPYNATDSRERQMQRDNYSTRLKDDRKQSDDEPNDDEEPRRAEPGSKEIRNQRHHIERLMKNIDRPLDIASNPKSTTVKAPPEIVLNVRGSSAGAGSSDFHTYRNQRRKENLRVQLMEKEAAQDEAKDKYETEIASLKRRDEEKTAKNRAKRQKRKQQRSSKSDNPEKADN